MSAGAPRAAADLLARCGEDRIAREQYLDFLKCRAYRQTLVCREELRLPEAPSADAARELLAAAPVPTSPRAEPSGRSKVEFRTPKGATLTTDHPVPKRACSSWGAWPQRLGFETVLERAAARLGANVDVAGSARAHRPVAARLRGEPHPPAHTSPGHVAEPGERPRGSALARRRFSRSGTRP